MFCRPLAAIVAAALATPAFAQEPASFHSAISAKAPSVLKLLKEEKKYTNVGVLKFLVKQGDGPVSDDAGDLNLSLALKTEKALILKNTDEKFGIIDNPSEVVVREKLSTANHKSERGRRAFFNFKKYELAYSRDPVEASAFLTATVTMAADLKSMSIQLHVFDSTGMIYDIPGAVVATPDPELLAQARMSYAAPKNVVRALVSGKAPPPKEELQKEAIESMKKTAETPEVKDVPFAPLVDSPIKMTILYNGVPVKVTGSQIPEPKADDIVTFKLENPGPGTFAAVLLINGESTLYQEKMTPNLCRKWVLEPGGEVTIQGFQTSEDKAAPFRVTRPDEPIADAVRYGPHAGTFRLVVFAGNLTDKPTERINRSDADDELLALANTRGSQSLGKKKPQSLKNYQNQLRGGDDTMEGSRGLVVKSDDQKTFETKAVYFAPITDVPVADISLKYIK